MDKGKCSNDMMLWCENLCKIFIILFKYRVWERGSGGVM